MFDIDNLKNKKKYILVLFLLVILVVLGTLGYSEWLLPDEAGQSGTEEVVTGYAVIRHVEGFSELHGQIDQDNVYLEIIDYLNENFMQAYEEKISDGNTVNIKEDENILFNLGCLKYNEIIADGKDDNYIDKTTQAKILESTRENSVKIVLHFKTELGKDCLCCSFADKLSLYTK